MFMYANYLLNFSKLLGVTPESKVDTRTSQNQILQMYESGREIPWDVRKEQPALARAEREGHIRGLVLDAGCGYGDNAIYLALKGYRVVGFDFSGKAVEVARERAKQSGVGHLCEFVEADALNVSTSCLRGRKFDTVLDSACLQCFSPAVQETYLENMASLMARGGGFVLLVVCNQSQLRSWCRGLKWMQTHLTQLFTTDKGWSIEVMSEDVFIENIPMVKITKGVRSFEPVTPSPCILMRAERKVSFPWQNAVLVGAPVVAALGLVAFSVWMRKR